MKEYTTVSGDMWDSIAFNQYGDESKITELIRANPKHAQTVVFTAGVVLNIPEIEIQEDFGLPPWKRVSG